MEACDVFLGGEGLRVRGSREEDDFISGLVSASRDVEVAGVGFDCCAEDGGIGGLKDRFVGGTPL